MYQRALFFIIIFQLVFVLSSFNFPERPAGNHLVLDYAKMLSHTDKLQLSAHLENFKDTSGIELLIVTIPQIDKRSIAQYSVELAKSWQKAREIKPLTIIMILEKKNLHLGIGTGKALINEFPPTIAENLEKKHFIPGSGKELQKSLLIASTRVMEIATGTLEETSLTKSISPFIFWLLLILFIFFFVVYPLLLYRSVRRSTLSTKPVSFYHAITLKRTFGSSNIGGFDEFSTGRGPFAGRTHDEIMESIRYGGGAGGMW